MPLEIQEQIRALPKVEQHVHIVGSARPETLLWLTEEAGLHAPFRTVQEARRFFQYDDFRHFISIYSMIVDCITEENQFERITYEMLENDAHCNVRYVEASFSAPDHVFKDLNYGRMLDAINRGVRRAEHDFGIKCNLRIDLVRNYGPEVGMEVLNWIESKGDNIISIDIGGSEQKFPPRPFKTVYHRAREIGLHLVAHAGEAAGPRSIWDALRYLGVEHIGHGLAAIKDPRLMNYLAKQGVTIEMCPTSNVKTGAISSIDKHPIRTFLDQGINVTVSTDDPSMFSTNMNSEYLQLHKRLNFTIRELFDLSLNAVDSCFLPEKQRMHMRQSLVEEFQRLMKKWNTESQ